MKDIISVIVVICAMLILVSCEDKDEVADEIVDYYNEEWVSINDEKEKAMRNDLEELAEFEEEDETKETANLVRNEFLPLIEDVLKELKSIDSPNKKVKKMNDMQIEAEEQAEKMFKDGIIYYEDGDVSEEDLKKNNDKLEDKYDNVLDYRDKLMDKYDLEKVENDDEDSKYDKLKRTDD